jgi:sulfur carrier protein
MKLVINGEDADGKDGISVSELLIEQHVKMPEMVSVELNGSIVRRENFDATNLKEGDKVEFLYFMGGGNVAD